MATATGREGHPRYGDDVLSVYGVLSGGADDATPVQVHDGSTAHIAGADRLGTDKRVRKNRRRALAGAPGTYCLFVGAACQSG